MLEQEKKDWLGTAIFIGMVLGIILIFFIPFIWDDVDIDETYLNCKMWCKDKTLVSISKDMQENITACICENKEFTEVYLIDKHVGYIDYFHDKEGKKGYREKDIVPRYYIEED